MVFVWFLSWKFVGVVLLNIIILFSLKHSCFGFWASVDIEKCYFHVLAVESHIEVIHPDGTEDGIGKSIFLCAFNCQSPGRLIQSPKVVWEGCLENLPSHFYFNRRKGAEEHIGITQFVDMLKSIHLLFHFSTLWRWIAEGVKNKCQFIDNITRK